MSRSLDDINDEEWLANFGAVLGAQIVKLYNEFPEEKVCDIHAYAFVCVFMTQCVHVCSCVCLIQLILQGYIITYFITNCHHYLILSSCMFLVVSDLLVHVKPDR